MANKESGTEFDSLGKEAQETPKDRQINELQEDLAAEQKARKVDVFLFILVGTIVLDIHVFSSMQSWAGPVSILALEVLLLLVLAERFDISIVEQAVDKALGAAKVLKK